MICQKCKKDFQEREIETSHDVYEKTIFSIMIKPLPENIKEEMKIRASIFAETYFKEIREKINLGEVVDDST